MTMRKKKESPAVMQPAAIEEPVVKRGRKSKKAVVSSEAQVSAETVSEPTEKKIDGRTKEGRLQKINADIESLTKKRNALLEEYSSASVMLKNMLERVKFLSILLSAFNALTDKGEVKLEKPEKGTAYWYIRSMPMSKHFEVVACQWNDWTSDHYRYCKGNMFLDVDVCHSACQAMNEMLSEL